MPDPGQTVGGRYRLVRPLGEGGMATVWAAEHLTMGNIVAVKIISAELLECDLAITRFSREARAAAKLRSPYVVQLFDHDVDPVLGPYIAMELLEGESLAERLERERTLSPNDLCRILQQVSKGLMRAHAEGIVHRDMKPDNIFLAVDDDAVETAKILDFGVAKAESPLNVRGSNKTVVGALVGTLNYMSPEQAQGQEVNHLTDLWALGVIAFECLVGRRPFEDDAPGAVVMQICAHPIAVPSALNPDVPPGFDAWFAQACNRDPAQRFQSSEELARSLTQVCDADELSIEDVLIEVPVLLAHAPTADPAAPPARAKKRRVLQLVDSTFPPPPPDQDDEAEEMLALDIEFVYEPEYFVAHGSSSVGPISLETVRVGYQVGYVAVDSLVWTAGWPSWRNASEVFAALTEGRRKRPLPNLSLIGPICTIPPGAPALPPPTPPLTPSTRPPAPKRSARPPASKRSAPPASTPVSEVRATSRKPHSRETSYYLTDGAVTVGPVRASMLRRGLEEGKIPGEVLAWRDGWNEWQLVSGIGAELETSPLAPLGMLRSRPGIEAVGLKTRHPPAAPPVVHDKSGRSKR